MIINDRASAVGSTCGSGNRCRIKDPTTLAEDDYGLANGGRDCVPYTKVAGGAVRWFLIRHYVTIGQNWQLYQTLENETGLLK